MTQRILVEVPRAHYVEARGLQRLRDQAGVVGGGIQGTGLIPGIADHQSNAFFRLRRAGRHGECERDKRKQHGDERANSWHDGSMEARQRAPERRSYHRAVPLNGI